MWGIEKFKIAQDEGGNGCHFKYLKRMKGAQKWINFDAAEGCWETLNILHKFSDGWGLIDLIYEV